MQRSRRKTARDGWAMFDQPRNASDYEHANAQQKKEHFEAEPWGMYPYRNQH